MQLRDYVNVLRHRLPLIALAALLGLCVPLATQHESASTYTASSELMFSVSGGNSATDLNQAATYLERSMPSYAKLTTTPLVLDPVRSQLGLSDSIDDLQKDVTATAPTGTILLDIAATRDDPKEAARLANAVSDQMVKTVSRMSPADQKGASTFKASVVTPAETPKAAAHTSKVMLALAGLVIGALLGAVLAFLVDALDGRVRSATRLRSVAGRPVLAEVDGRLSSAESARRHGGSKDTADVGRLSNGVDRLLRAEDQRVLAVTSLGSEDGSASITAQLGSWLTRSGHKVLVVDGTTGGSGLHRLLGASDAEGLTNVLATDGPTWASVVQKGTAGMPDLLAAGTGRPETVQPVNETRMQRLLSEFLNTYDTVLVNVPPARHPSAEAFAQLSGGALVLVPLGRARDRSVAATLERFNALGLRHVGVAALKARGLARLV